MVIGRGEIYRHLNTPMRNTDTPPKRNITPRNVPKPPLAARINNL
jgi:hypothetical protein